MFCCSILKGFSLICWLIHSFFMHTPSLSFIHAFSCVLLHSIYSFKDVYEESATCQVGTYARAATKPWGLPVVWKGMIACHQDGSQVVVPICIHTFFHLTRDGVSFLSPSIRNGPVTCFDQGNAIEERLNHILTDMKSSTLAFLEHGHGTLLKPGSSSTWAAPDDTMWSRNELQLIWQGRVVVVAFSDSVLIWPMTITR